MYECKQDLRCFDVIRSQLEHGPDVDWAMGPMPDWLDAYHFADVTYVFGIPLLQPGATYEDPEVKFSMEIMKMWSNFAKKGSVHKTF